MLRTTAVAGLTLVPVWLKSERFDVEAKAEGDPSFEARRCVGFFAGPGHLGGRSMSIGQLRDSLSLLTGRIVQDRTGLKGMYDIDLQYSPDAGASPDSPQSNPSGPSLFTALQEQLGLKLESQKGPVEIMVIDHVERPSEN